MDLPPSTSQATSAWTERLARLVRSTHAWLETNDRTQSHLARRLAVELHVGVPTAKVKLSRFLSGQLVPTERSLPFVEILEALVRQRDNEFRPLDTDDVERGLGLDGTDEALWIGDLVVKNHRERLQQLLDAHGGPDAFLHDHELYGQACEESVLDPRVGLRRRTNMLDFYARNLQHVVEEGLGDGLRKGVLAARVQRVRQLTRAALERRSQLPAGGLKPCLEQQLRHHLGSMLVLAGLLGDESSCAQGLAELQSAMRFDVELGWIETEQGRVSVLRDVVLNNGLTVCSLALESGLSDACKERVVSAAEEVARGWPAEHRAIVLADRSLNGLRSRSSFFAAFAQGAER